MFGQSLTVLKTLDTFFERVSNPLFTIKSGINNKSVKASIGFNKPNFANILNLNLHIKHQSLIHTGYNTHAIIRNRWPQTRQTR